MGNPRIPDNVKQLTGTARADRALPEGVGIDAPALEEVPAAPDWLPNAHAVNEWDRVAPLLVRLGVLTETALAALGHMCALHGTMVQQWSAGLVPQASAVQQYRGLVAEFGLTPVSSAKVKQIKADGKPANPFNRHGQRSRGKT